jgi:hypothetical protein
MSNTNTRKEPGAPGEYDCSCGFQCLTERKHLDHIRSAMAKAKKEQGGSFDIASFQQLHGRNEEISIL